MDLREVIKEETSSDEGDRQEDEGIGLLKKI